MERQAVLARFRTGLPARFEPATGDLRLHGALITADPVSGRAESIERVAVTSAMLEAWEA
jgi:2',3'-cyclic-nucleotide 2'-phosphodiesterase